MGKTKGRGWDVKEKKSGATKCVIIGTHSFHCGSRQRSQKDEVQKAVCKASFAIPGGDIQVLCRMQADVGLQHYRDGPWLSFVSRPLRPIPTNGNSVVSSK